MEEKNDAESSDANESMEGKNDSDANKAKTKKVQGVAAKLKEKVDTMPEKADTMLKKADTLTKYINEKLEGLEEWTDRMCKIMSETSDMMENMMENMMKQQLQLKIFIQHLEFKETKGGKSEKVDTGETNLSTGSEQTDY